MPRLELSPADHGSRSTLYVSKTGAIYRQYHDTQTWAGPLSAHAGVQGDRFSGKRTVSSLVRAAWSDQEGQCEEEHKYRGGPVQALFDGFEKHFDDDLGPRIKSQLLISLLYICSQYHRAFLSGQIPSH